MELEQAAGKALAAARPVKGAIERLCPHCGEAMTTVETRGVEIDRCDSCALVWIDGSGEKLGQLSAADIALFTLSLPERAARGVLGGLGGAAHEVAKIVLPGSIRNTRVYRSAIEGSLRFLVEDLGGVEGRFDSKAPEQEAARAAVGGFLDMAGSAVLHASPIWVLAAVSDVTRGSKAYLDELQSELVRRQVLPEGTTVGGIGELLDVVEKVSGKLADDIEHPPLSVDALRASYEQIKSEVARVGPDQAFPVAEQERTWQEMNAIAKEQGRSVFEVSTAVAIASSGMNKVATTAWASVSVGADMLYEGVFKHYGSTLTEIHERGYYATIAGAAGPYLEQAVGHMDASKESVTERLLSGRLVKELWRKRGKKKE